MTDTQTIDIKKLQKEKIQHAIQHAQKRASDFKSHQDNLESIYRKFFDEISKKCDYFTLVETPLNEYFLGTIYAMNDNGTFNYSKTIQVHSECVSYKSFEIRINPGVCKAFVQIIVDEDISYARRGSRGGSRKNNGWKIQARIRYNDSPKYKTGGSIVKLINQQIEQEENQRKHEEMVNANRKKIKDALSETFPYCFAHPLIDNKEYLVDVKDGVKLKVKTTIKDDGSVLITPTGVELSNKSLGIVMKSLETI